MRFKISAGKDAQVLLPAPHTFKQLLRYVKQYYNSKQIVIQYIKPQLTLHHNGEVFKNILPSFSYLIKQKAYFSQPQPRNTLGSLLETTTQEDINTKTINTPYVISGKRYLFLYIAD